jgi:hypothetical protein
MASIKATSKDAGPDEPAVETTPFQEYISAVMARDEELMAKPYEECVREGLSDNNGPALEIVTEDEAEKGLDEARNDPSIPQMADGFILPGNGQTISASAEGIFSIIAERECMFLRGGSIVEISTTDGEEVMEDLKDQAFRSRIESYGTIYALRKRSAGRNGGSTVVQDITTCSQDAAKAIMAAEEREVLPKVRLLSNSHFLHEDEAGDPKLSKTGLNEFNGGIFVNERAQAIEDMTWEEARDLLRDMLSAYEFLTPADLTRALAMLLAPAFRLGGWLEKIPALVTEADQSQTGKTYICRLIAAIYGETAVEFSGKGKGGVGSLDESFGSALATGRPFMLVDNFRGKLDSCYIESFLTGDRLFQVRIPHKAAFNVRPNSALVMFSSNGMEMTKDMMNRACFVRIRKRSQQWRQFEKGGLLEHVRDNSGKYLGAVHALIRLWFDCAKVRSKERRHDFQDWAQIMDAVVPRAFDLPPLLEGHQEIKERVTKPPLVFFRAVALELEQRGELGQEMRANQIADLAEMSDIDIPSKSGRVNDPTKQVGIVAGNAFGKKDVMQIEIDDFTIRRERKTYGDGYDAFFYTFHN